MLRKWITATLITILFLSGCSNHKEVVKEHSEKQVDGVEKGKIEKYPYSYPLTGLGSREEPTGRAYAVMINNHPKARPQSGLDKADMIYEVLAEGNVTRFLAIFQSEQAENIGPVRSARDYYIELAKGYDALYIAHGYSPEAKEMLESGYIDNINGMHYDGTWFKRLSTRVAPHNSYITSENILKGADKLGYDMNEELSPLLFLKDDEVKELTGQDAQSVSIKYSSNDQFNVMYEYDSDLQKFKRYSDGELTIDLESEEPVLLDNIFIVETDHNVIDDQGRRDVDLLSGGNAYLLQKGKWKGIEWRNIDGRILPYSNGEVVGFVPGKTWINIIPSKPGLKSAVSFNAEQS
jgi:hypothetical protein